MGAPSTAWVLESLRKLLTEHERKAMQWRARSPIEQEDDETLAEFRQRQAEAADQQAWADHYAREEDDRANVLRQAIRCLGAARPAEPQVTVPGTQSELIRGDE